VDWPDAIMLYHSSQFAQARFGIEQTFEAHCDWYKIGTEEGRSLCGLRDIRVLRFIPTIHHRCNAEAAGGLRARGCWVRACISGHIVQRFRYRMLDFWA